MGHNEYAVFVGTRWARTGNKRDAIRLAKKEHGTVRVLRDVGYFAWDAPTFIACSSVVADYSEVSE